MWCIAEMDAEYVRKMEDVLAVYEKPYRSAEPVVCLDEKPVSLHADLRTPLPARPGQVAKRDNEYKRCGTANVFCAVEPKAGRHFTFPTPDRSAPELARVLESNHPQLSVCSIPFTWSWTISISTAGRPSPTTSVRKRAPILWSRLAVHYTPKHGSWLNQAEIEISLFARQCLGKRRIPSLVLLQREAHAWNRKINRDKTTIDWRFSRKKARQKFGYDKNSFTRS